MQNKATETKNRPCVFFFWEYNLDNNVNSESSGHRREKVICR